MEFGDSMAGGATEAIAGGGDGFEKRGWWLWYENKEG